MWNDTEMTCPLPYFYNLPSELINANSSSREYDSAVLYPVASLDNMDVSLSLYLGFIMDKFTSLRNISKTKRHLRLELIPIEFYCDQTPVTFDPAVNQHIKIKVIQ